MTKLYARGEKIRKFILEHVGKHSGDIAKVTAQKFNISRQAANRHLKRLVDEESLAIEGKTKSRKYKLRKLLDWSETFYIPNGLEEDVIWRDHLTQQLGTMPDNVGEIWHYSFTEMFNNAIDHSGGNVIYVRVSVSANDTQIALYDDGVGIFKKIQQELDLLDERHSVLELAKGKLTTDPTRHTGEGIFFTSRMLDDFQILSGATYFSHTFGETEDWILERDKFSSGTTVLMKLNNHTSRKIGTVFKKFMSGDDFGFNKTVVPVKLAQYGDDKLVSRSQAKRLISRFERFKIVILDFRDVDGIGQAFADEIFRVFSNRFPEIQLSPVNTNTEIDKMIERARSNS